MVIKFGKWLTRHKAVVLIIAFLLLIHDCRRRHGEEGHCGSQRKIKKSESCGGRYLV